MNFVLYHIEFPHICNIYDDNNIFYIYLWGFTNDPLYLVYNPAEQENIVSCIFHFQRSIRSQIDQGFWSIIFSSGGTQWTFESHLERPEGRTSIGGMAQEVGRATHLRSPLGRLIALIFSPTDVFFPKNVYIYGSEEFSGGE
jgi:hypothetical protein